jgi:hypothetical protein
MELNADIIGKWATDEKITKEKMAKAKPVNKTVNKSEIVSNLKQNLQTLITNFEEAETIMNDKNVHDAVISLSQVKSALNKL